MNVILPPITAFRAQQIVAQHVVVELSTQLMPDTAELTGGERLCWSVPVIFTLPSRGRLGQVGTLRVDAQTGELLTTPQLDQEILDNAQRLAERAALPTGT